ncbi:MAG TPA: hypothetical protein VH643_12045 [Gemmataceae bacterium]|jgi:transposase-like protein
MTENGNKKTGRPIEITSELIVRAGQLAGETLYVECVAGRLGISRSTLYRWLRRGQRERRRRERGLVPKDREQSFLDFSDSVEKGFAEAEARHLANIQSAGNSGTWQASAWVLERSHPERWSLERNELRRLKRIVQKMLKDHNQRIDEEELYRGRY